MLPHITPFFFEEEPSRGESVQVGCYVTKGDLPVKFSWDFNDKPIDNQILSVLIEPHGKKTSLLSIESVDETHIGNYTCIATNKAGIATFSAELLVKGLIFCMNENIVYYFVTHPFRNINYSYTITFEKLKDHLKIYLPLYIF